MFFLTLLRQVWVLTLEEIRELMLRKRALLSLVIYVIALAGSIWLLIRVQTVVGLEVKDFDLRSPQVKPLRDALEQAGVLPYMGALLQLRSVPSLLWLFQLFSVIWLPSLVALVSCDMVAVDINRGTLRFLLLRTSRLGYFLSKLLSHILLYMVLHFASLIMIIWLSFNSIGTFDLVSTVLLALKYLVVFLPYVGFVVAATLWVSSWSRRPLGALVKIHVLWLLIFILAIKAPDWTPFNMDLVLGLFVPFQTYPLWSFLGYLGWTIGFAVIAWLGFGWRDV